MARKQATCQQLVYLDELKQRLRELRLSQETYMEETAEILRHIDTDELPLKLTPTESVTPSEKPLTRQGYGSIKQLISRFEDLRQTSQHFSEQRIPEELPGVDVRKLLHGYENLIAEGNILQKNWLLLKRTTESCVHPKPFSRAEQLQADVSWQSVKPPEKKSRKSLKFSIQSSKQKSTEEVESESTPNMPKLKMSRSNCVKHITFSIETHKYAEEVDQENQSCDKESGRRFGTLMQFLLRINPFTHCIGRKSVNKLKK